MEIGEALYSYLSSYTDLTSLVGTRIYPDILPQKCSNPSIAYQQIDEGELDTFSQPNTLIYPVYQFTIYADTRSSANAVAKQLRLAFKNYSGAMGGDGGVTVSAVKKISRISDYSDDTKEYKVIMDFEIWYQE